MTYHLVLYGTEMARALLRSAARGRSFHASSRALDRLPEQTSSFGPTLGDLGSALLQFGPRLFVRKMMMFNGEMKLGSHVGEDELGNNYYENTAYPYPRHRWVEYAGLPWTQNCDPSDVGAEWHGWLHNMTDQIPATVRRPPCPPFPPPPPRARLREFVVGEGARSSGTHATHPSPIALSRPPRHPRSTTSPAPHCRAANSMPPRRAAKSSSTATRRTRTTRDSTTASTRRTRHRTSGVGTAPAASAPPRRSARRTGRSLATPSTSAATSSSTPSSRAGHPMDRPQRSRACARSTSSSRELGAERPSLASRGCSAALPA